MKTQQYQNLFLSLLERSQTSNLKVLEKKEQMNPKVDKGGVINSRAEMNAMEL
jgi:hypothetical protein